MPLHLLLALTLAATGAGLQPSTTTTAQQQTAGISPSAVVREDEPTDDLATVTTAPLVVASEQQAETATAEAFGAEASSDVAPAPSASAEQDARDARWEVPDEEEADDAAPRVTEDEAAEQTVDPAQDTVVADALTDDGRVLTPAVTTDGVQTIGVTWPDDAQIDGLVAQVRTLVEGDWTGWSDLDASDTAPDAGTADDAAQVRGGTDSFWIGEALAVQLSFAATGEGGPPDLDLALVGSPLTEDAGVQPSASDGEAVFRTALATADSAAVVQAATAPTVIRRTEWGARAQACAPDVAGSLVGAVVHHTAGGNTYSTVAAAMQQIRNDQAYHITGRGWCDIGYNFIVDKWGNIYEGRAGSMTSAVIGVHAGGFNTGTVGVAMLGTYTTAPPAATVNAVGRVIGWRLGQYYRDPRGSMSYTTGNGENSRYQNTTVVLPRVFGHRDVSFTTCPGNGGYAALASIRTVAASNLIPPTTKAEARALVKALYRDLLGRSVDPSGMDTWSGELLAGRAPAVVVDALTKSAEYRRLRVRQAYQEVFGRVPDEGGLRMWVAEVASGRLAIDDVKRKLLDSGEFLSRAGGTPEGYVARLYSSVLQREGSESEVSAWAAQFRSAGRSAVASAIWGSKESAMRRVQVYYPLLLGRASDRGGLETWSGVLLREGEQSVRNGMAASAEYRKRAVIRFP